MDDADEDPGYSYLADPSRVPLIDLIRSGDSVLDNVLRRLVADAARTSEAISGWSSFIE